MSRCVLTASLIVFHYLYLARNRLFFCGQVNISNKPMNYWNLFIVTMTFTKLISDRAFSTNDIIVIQTYVYIKISWIMLVIPFSSWWLLYSHLYVSVIVYLQSRGTQGSPGHPKLPWFVTSKIWTPNIHCTSAQMLPSGQSQRDIHPKKYLTYSLSWDYSQHSFYINIPTWQL